MFLLTKVMYSITIQYLLERNPVVSESTASQLKLTDLFQFQDHRRQNVNKNDFD